MVLYHEKQQNRWNRLPRLTMQLSKNAQIKKTLKDYCKKWSVGGICAELVLCGMKYQQGKLTVTEAVKMERILAAELRRRINQKKI